MTEERRRIDFRVPTRLLKHGQRCRSCSAPIVFWSLSAGKNPLDVQSAKPDPDATGFSRLESHFAHCPRAAAFRRATADRKAREQGRRPATAATEEIRELYGRGDSSGGRP